MVALNLYGYLLILINIVLVSVVFVLHIPVATVSLLLSNVDFKTMTPGTVVSIGNPSRTTMYGNIAAAWSCKWNMKYFTPSFMALCT